MQNAQKMDPGTPGLQWTRHAGLVHNLLDFAHQNVNDAFLAQGAVERPRKRPLRRLPWAKGPRRPTRPQEPFKGPRRPRGHYPGDPQRFPASPCLFQHAHEAPRRGPQEATQEPRRRPPRRPPQAPGKTSAGPHWTPGHHPGVTPKRHSRPMLIGFATFSTRDWYKIHGLRRNKKTLLDNLCVVHWVFTKHI